MTDLGFEMHSLKCATPCIDAALAVIEATKRSLGTGNPEAGVEHFTIEQDRIISCRDAMNDEASGLGSLCLSNEAWWIAFAPHQQDLNAAMTALSLRLDSMRDYMLELSECIGTYRTQLDTHIANLNMERTAILAASSVGVIALYRDPQTAAAAMFQHDNLVCGMSAMRDCIAQKIDLSCHMSARRIASLQARRDAFTPYNTATGPVSMPTEQLQIMSTYLVAKSVELEAQTCGPGFLGDIEQTRGQFFAQDLIPALAKYRELHNTLLASLSAEARFLAEGLNRAAQSYMNTDASAAATIAGRAQENNDQYLLTNLAGAH